MRGPDSWEGRPRDYPTIRVSTLPKEIRDLFKQNIGKRRWTTVHEVERLRGLLKYPKRREPDA